MKKWWILGAVILLCVIIGVVSYIVWWHATHYTTVETDYHEPKPDEELKLVDDRLEDKNPEFDPELVDSRPLGEWEVNLSAAVTKLDCPVVKPDSGADLLVLRPSYADAISAAKQSGKHVLPSVNLLDGAAKQFDDGLYAAMELAAMNEGIGDIPPATVLIGDLFAKLPEQSPARPHLAAALKLAGTDIELTPDEIQSRDALIKTFQANPSLSKPISFYNWTPQLQQAWQFFRFLQQPFSDEQMPVAKAIAQILKEDQELLAQYKAVNAFYGQLTNPPYNLSVDALLEEGKSLETLAEQRKVRKPTVSILPASTSRETELFEQLFPVMLPPNVNLMTALIKKIRSGKVDLSPKENSGWYQYQVYALETMLLADKTQENEKLLLTANYKRRLIEAFKAMMTKRRETHARQLMAGDTACAPLDEGAVRPRLRVEPNLTFYLRTARAYAFLQNLLSQEFGGKLSGMHALRKGGSREPNLADELESIKLRFYGFYLVGCEDIGMRPEFMEGEEVDEAKAEEIALKWLENLKDDPDLACDTRVAVPIFNSRRRGKTRLWGMIGVRLAPLEASYARSPKVRPLEEKGEWQEVEPYQLSESHYVIPVDDFAEFEIDGLNALTRKQFREICDKHKSKEKIVEALSKM